MSRLPLSRPGLKTGLAAATFAALSLTGLAGALAAEVSQVQLGFTDSGSQLCPRIITMKAWAHTSGPGAVEFVIRNSSGNTTGVMTANAVKGPTGNWLATLTHKFKITTDVDTKYMAEVKGSGKISAWVPLKEVCVGVAPKTVYGGPKGKHISEVDKGKPGTQGGGKPSGQPSGNGKPTNDSKPIPQGGGKPLPQGDTKPLAQCLNTSTSATRIAAVTKQGGLSTAWLAWEHAVKKVHGSSYANAFAAKNRKESCTWLGTYTCKVSATPCRS